MALIDASCPRASARQRGAMAFARQPAGPHSTTTAVVAGQHTACRFGTRKMPGEPMRVQPSRAKRSTSEDAAD
jgi:hypothetical protein